eukprot:scaffold36966_cov30-Tisochrysis_lutea.AAC.4
MVFGLAVLHPYGASYGACPPQHIYTSAKTRHSLAQHLEFENLILAITHLLQQAPKLTLRLWVLLGALQAAYSLRWGKAYEKHAESARRGSNMEYPAEASSFSTPAPSPSAEARRRRPCHLSPELACAD